MQTTREYIIPKGEAPQTMPDGICIPYIYDACSEEEALTEELLQQLLQGIRQGNNIGIYLGKNEELEDGYMNLEIDNGWISILITEETDGIWECDYSTFNPDYLDSQEESPMQHSDGQSIIWTRYTMHDIELAALCTEYYARTGTIYPGMAWLKCSSSPDKN